MAELSVAVFFQHRAKDGAEVELSKLNARID